MNLHPWSLKHCLAISASQRFSLGQTDLRRDCVTLLNHFWYCRTLQSSKWASICWVGRRQLLHKENASESTGVPQFHQMFTSANFSNETKAKITTKFLFLRFSGLLPLPYQKIRKKIVREGKFVVSIGRKSLDKKCLCKISRLPLHLQREWHFGCQQ